MDYTKRKESNMPTGPGRLAVTGLPGSGKTTLVYQLAEKFKLTWFDLDNSGEILDKIPEEYQKNVNYIRIPCSASNPMAAETLLNLWKKRKGLICHMHGKFECPICKKDPAVNEYVDFTKLDVTKDIVVIDTGTELGNAFLMHLTKDKDVEYKCVMDDWGGLLKYTKFMKSEWKDSPFNLVVTFHVAETKFDNGSTKLTPSFGSSTMCQEIGGAFNTIVYCETVNKKFKADSNALWSNTVLTKSRGDFEIEKLAIPSLLPLFERAKEFSRLENNEDINKAKEIIAKMKT